MSTTNETREPTEKTEPAPVTPEKKPEKPKKERNVGTRVIDFRYFPFDFGRFTGAPPCLLWFRPRWFYVSKQAKKRIRGGAILMMNHNGFFDPILSMLCVWYRRQHFVATKELFEGGKFRRWLFSLFHCVKIDRENFNLRSFREITDHLENGNVVTIYPEGHINFTSKEVATFKLGLVMMALRSGAPIVPVYIRPPKKWYNRAVFCIGEPIVLKDRYSGMPSMEDIEKISDELRGAEIRLKEYIQEKTSK